MYKVPFNACLLIYRFWVNSISCVIFSLVVELPVAYKYMINTISLFSNMRKEKRKKNVPLAEKRILSTKVALKKKKTYFFDFYSSKGAVVAQSVECRA